MPSNRLIKPFESYFVTLIFIFSTMYTLYYYYNIGISQQTVVAGLSDNPNDPLKAGFLGVLNAVLEYVSWLSPFALVKALILAISPSDLYTFLNLLILRPVGWIGALFTANYIISKIPTESSE